MDHEVGVLFNSKGEIHDITQHPERITAENRRLAKKDGYHWVIMALVPTEADMPAVTKQLMNDCGINPFAAELISESFVKHPNPKPISFRYGSAIFHMRPVEEPEPGKAS